ncbi:glycosyltransferase family 9 protein [bacterium]|nr:glycosyltransferase family 9 protein [bacterium]
MIERLNKVLIIRCGAIGDVLHTSEVFRSIKRAYPDCIIHYLTTEIPAKMLSADKDIDKFITVNQVTYKNLFQILPKLKNENYDVIINLQPSFKLRLIALLAKAKKILNYEKNLDKHAVFNFYETAEKGIKNLSFKNELKIYVPNDIKEMVKIALPTEKKFIVMTTQAGPVREGKKWRVDRFKKLVLDIINKYDVAIIFTGTSADRESLTDFENLHQDIYNMAGRFNILESAAMFSLAEYMIGADTGPIHIASATDKPICIGLYGAMAIHRTGLVGKKHHSVKSSKLSCIPCQKRFCKLRNGEYSPCMDDISPEDIMKILEQDNILPLK